MEGTEDMNCVLFGGSDDLLFDVLVNRAMENCQKKTMIMEGKRSIPFDCAQEPCPHIDTLKR